MTPEQLAAIRAQTCPTCGLLSPSLVYQALQLQEAALTTTQAQLAAAEARIERLERVAKAARDFAEVIGPRGGYLTVYTALEDALAAVDADA